MSKLLILVVGGVAFLISPVCYLGSAQEKKATRDYKKIADEAEWTWRESDANLSGSIQRHLVGYKVEISVEDYFTGSNGGFEIRLMQDGKQRYTFKGHSETVFTRIDDILFITDQHRLATGCEVTAVDLKTGNELWHTTLQGIGPIMHSKYRNQVTIENDGQAIIVLGKESSGRYIEILDKDTGKTLANKVFK